MKNLTVRKPPESVSESSGISTNRRLRVLSNCNQLILRATDEQHLLGEICRILVETGGHRLAWIGIAHQVQNQPVQPVAWHGIGQQAIKQLQGTRAADKPGRSPVETAMRTGKTVVCRKIMSDDRHRHLRREAKHLGYSACIVFPLRIGKTLWGSLSIYSEDGQAFRTEERKLLSEAARDTVFGIHSLRLRKQLEQSLKTISYQERRYKDLVDNTPDYIFSLDRTGRFTAVNKALCQALDAGEQDLLGRHFDNVGWGESVARTWRSLMERTLKNRRGEEGELTTLFPGGKPRVFHCISHPLRDVRHRIAGIRGVWFDITEQRQTERELARIREQHDLILEAAGEGIHGLDNDGKTTFVNPAAGRLLGWEPEDLTGKDQHSLIHHSHPDGTPYQREQCPIYAAFKDGKIHRIEDEVFWRKDGSSFPVEYISTPIISPEGDLVGAVVTFRDITKRVQALEERTRSKTILEAVNRIFKQALVCETLSELASTCLETVEEITHSAFGFLGFLNPSGHMDTLAISNPGWEQCRVPGSKATLITRDMEIRGIDRSTIREGVSRIVNDPDNHPDRVGTPAGHPRITAFLGVPLLDVGKVIGMVGLANKPAGYNRHDQEAVEKIAVAIVQVLQRFQAETARRESEMKFRNLIKQSNDGIFVLQDRRLVFINPQFTKITGYTLPEIGKDFLYKRLLTDEAKTMIERWEKQHDKGTFPSGRYELTGLTKGGQSIHMEISLGTFDWEGKSALLGVVRDVTERVQTRIELQNALQKAQQSDRIKTQFLANISHEIRTPLNSILGFTDLIKHSLSDRLGTEESQFFDIIQMSGKRLTRTIHSILDISQIETGTFELKIETIELNTQIRTVIEEFKPQAEHKNLNLIYKPSRSQEYTRCNRYSIEQILTYLIDNSVNYTEKGSIEVSLRARRNRLFLVVRDTGIGMTGNFQKRMYDIFTQESTGYNKKYQGVGLGLSLVKRYCDWNGVSLTVESHKGQGTTFNLIFKRHKKRKKQ